MAANTIPTVSTLPPAPTRADAPADFTTKADTFVAALPPLVTQVNLTVKGMNDQGAYLDQLKADVNGYKTAAAQSVTDAATQVQLAKDQVTAATTQANNAKTYADNAKGFRDTAQTYAAAAQSAVGAPTLAGHAGDFLSVNADEQGVSWQPGMQNGFQEFTGAGVFNKPPKARWIYVEAIGGGSSGALNIQRTATRYIQGGLGGDFNFRLLRASDVDSSVPVTVGSGGASVSRTANSSEVSAPGNPGADSAFGSYLRALGAKAPATPSATPITVPRDGDLRGGFSGTSVNASELIGSSVKGGGPGASVAITSTPTVINGTAGTSQDAGNGGAAAQAGVFPGGGGGAVGSTATSGTVTSGAGAGGRIRVWWW